MSDPLARANEPREIVDLPEIVETPYRGRTVPSFALPMPASVAPDAAGIGEVFRGILRHKWLVVAIALASGAAAAAFGLMATPLYTAEGMLLLATPKTQVTDAKAVLDDLPLEAATVRSEIEALKSPAMADRVTDALELWNRRVYHDPDAPPPLLERLGVARLRAAILEALGFADAEPEAVGDERAVLRRDIAQSLANGIDPVYDGRSYVVRLKFSSPDPGLAAEIVNAYMTNTAADLLAAKTEATRRGKAWLQERLAELQRQVQADDLAVERWRAEHQITESRGVTVQAQQLSEINSQYVLAAAERAQRESMLRQVQSLRSGPNGAATAGQVLGSPIIQHLSEQEAEVQRRLAEEGAVFGDRHPTIIRLSSQRDEIRRKVRTEIDKVVASLSNDVAASRAREEQLKAQLDRLQRETSLLGGAEMKLRELQRNADVSRRIYENYLTREMEIKGQEEIAQSSARIVSLAKPPRFPSYPRKTLLVVLAVVAGSILGAFVASVLDRSERGFRQPRDLAHATGLPTLGHVPSIRRPGRALGSLVTQPQSMFAEAIRSIRTSLHTELPRARGVLILVTSAVPGEGKSLLAASLAHSVASSGQRTLLVDCDLRRPSIAQLMQDTNATGLWDVLADDVALEDVRRIDLGSSLHYVPSGVKKETRSPSDLLASRAMSAFLARCRRQYDAIILDTPPVLVVSDARVLARQVDQAVFVVRWRATRRDVVENAIDVLRAGGSAPVGLVLSRINVRKLAKLGVRDSAYYSARHAAYYR